ncbi:hypothetical protein IQ07DRAFT_175577 [Pyrenochaeta sp. DS3sAY3a]|nr:hypothetical protein IQ07DRAFT_175577 [Pyrenochaeta sp. DS3sAY3a]
MGIRTADHFIDCRWELQTFRMRCCCSMAKGFSAVMYAACALSQCLVRKTNVLLLLNRQCIVRAWQSDRVLLIGRLTAARERHRAENCGALCQKIAESKVLSENIPPSSLDFQSHGDYWALQSRRFMVACPVRFSIESNGSYKWRQFQGIV